MVSLPILFISNLPYSISSDDMYEIFGPFGDIIQIRLGNAKRTRGTAFVVYNQMEEAENARKQLDNFHVANRFLRVYFYSAERFDARKEREEKEEELRQLRKLVEEKKKMIHQNN